MLLGFTGKLGSGKDTAGERLVQLAGIEGVQLSFAFSLKESAAKLLDIDRLDWETYKNDPDVKVLLQTGWVDCEVVYDHDDDGNPLVGPGESPKIVREFTAREFLQRYGTEAHRDVFGQSFWVDQAMADYYRSTEVYFYFTDARFVNEAVAIRDNGGLIIRVLGDNEETGGHVSEAGLPDEYINFEIDNTVRDDDFANLDAQLTEIAQIVGIPVGSLV